MKNSLVRSVLGKLMNSALLVSSKRGLKQVALELFSGTGIISRHLTRRKIGCVAIDIKSGDCHDLTRPAVQSLIKD